MLQAKITERERERDQPNQLVQIVARKRAQSNDVVVNIA